VSFARVRTGSRTTANFTAALAARWVSQLNDTRNSARFVAIIAFRTNRSCYDWTCSCNKYEKARREKMIEKGLILTGSDAELLSRALSEVKTKVYEKSGAKLDDTQALDALVSYFLNAEWWTGKTSLVFTPLT
jgi:hypothetical protein